MRGVALMFLPIFECTIFCKEKENISFVLSMILLMLRLLGDTGPQMKLISSCLHQLYYWWRQPEVAETSKDINFICGLVFPSNPSMSLPSHSGIYSNVHDLVAYLDSSATFWLYQHLVGSGYILECAMSYVHWWLQVMHLILKWARMHTCVHVHVCN